MLSLGTNLIIKVEELNLREVDNIYNYLEKIYSSGLINTNILKYQLLNSIKYLDILYHIRCSLLLWLHHKDIPKYKIPYDIFQKSIIIQKVFILFSLLII